MPKELEMKLKHRAEAMARKHKLHRKKGETMKQAENAYVYGTLRKTGWTPSR